MGRPNGRLTHKPIKLTRSEQKFQRQWAEKEQRRLKRERDALADKKEEPSK